MRLRPGGPGPPRRPWGERRGAADCKARRRRPLHVAGWADRSPAQAVVFPEGTGAGSAWLRLDDAIERQGELRAIYEIAQAVARAATLEQVYEGAVRAVKHALAADRVALLVCDDEGVMRFQAWEGLSDRYRAATEGHSPWRGDEPDPAPVAIPDVAADESLGELRGAVLDEGISALAFIPLVVGGRLIGKFMLYFDRPHAFTFDELRLTQTIVGSIAIEIERRRTEAELRLSRDQLQAVFRSVPAGITVQDARGRLVYANEMAARLSGFSSSEEMLAAGAGAALERFELFDAEGNPLDPAELPGRRVLAGDQDAVALMRSRRLETGEEWWSEVRAGEIPGAGGNRFAVNVFRDVTEQRLAEERQRFLAEASAVLSSSLELDETLEQLARAVVPRLADWCVVHLLVEGEIRHVATAHAEEEKVRWARALQQRYPVRRDAARGVAAVLRSGEPMLVPQVSERMLEESAVDEEHLALLRRAGLHSAMAVPIKTGGATLGAITFIRSESARPFDDGDLGLAQQIAERAAVAIQHARLHEAERKARSAAERAHRRLEALESVSRVGLEIGEEEDVLERLLDRARAALAGDRAALLLLDRERGVLRIHCSVGIDPDAARAARIPLGAGVSGAIAARDAPTAIPDLSRVFFAGEYMPNSGSLVGVPLRVRGEVGGVLHVSADEPGAFGAEDVELLAAIADRFALVLERKELWEREHRIAETLQRSLLQEALPRVPGIAFACHYQPGAREFEVGGDWYDALVCRDGALALAVGDVVGKGLAAAAAMGRLRNALRAYAFEGREPAATLACLNDLEWRNGPSFTTVFLAKLDPAAGTLTYASAGHPPALLVHDGRVRVLDDAQGLPLGVEQRIAPQQRQCAVAEGDLLVAFSDGLVERHGRPLGEGIEMAVACAREPVHSCDQLVRRLLDALLEAPAEDDVAVLAAQLVPRRLRLELEGPDVLHEGRAALRQWLEAHGVGETDATAVTIAAWELLGNAIEHPLGRTRATVALDATVADGTVRVSVRDSGCWRPSSARRDRGLGLTLARGLVDSLDIVPSEKGTEVAIARTVA